MAPDVRLPYSTEGIPRIISIDSTLSGDMVRRSSPIPVDDCPERSLMPLRAVLEVISVASFDRGAPSRTIAAPMELFSSFLILLLSMEPTSLMLACPMSFTLVLWVTEPGVSCSMSSMLLGCRCCSAVWSMTDEEPMACCLAVTVTSAKERLEACSLMLKLVISFPLTLSTPLAVSYPT